MDRLTIIDVLPRSPVEEAPTPAPYRKTAPVPVAAAEPAQTEFRRREFKQSELIRAA